MILYIKFQQIISKDAIINSNIFMNEDTLVVFGSTIITGTKIGKHCTINASCSIDHDNKFSYLSSIFSISFIIKSLIISAPFDDGWLLSA